MLPINDDNQFKFSAWKLNQSSIHSLYVLEKGTNGWAHWVHAELVGVDQGDTLAVAIGFADNQVITFSDYLGWDTYRVYPVKGITLPQPPWVESPNYFVLSNEKIKSTEGVRS